MAFQMKHIELSVGTYSIAVILLPKYDLDSYYTPNDLLRKTLSEGVFCVSSHGLCIDFEIIDQDAINITQPKTLTVIICE